MQYRCVFTNDIYTAEQLQSIFKLKEYRGYNGSFDDWVKEEIEKGYLEKYNDKSLIAEKELLVKRYSQLLEQTDYYNNTLEQMENEFREFVNGKMGTDEFYDEAVAMISKMSRQKALRDSKYKDVLDMEKVIKGLK